jgi:glyoxylase-like metal-dependent hydrolase (beta-lactamase superfamily II)
MVMKTRIAATLLAVAVLALASAARAQAPDAKSAIDAAAKAMGAAGLRSVTYSGTAADVNFLQTKNINGPWPLRPITGYTRAIDLSQTAARATGATSNQGLFGGAPVAGVYNQNITPASATWTQQLDYWVTPWGFLRGAAANAATARMQRMNGRNYTVITWSPPLKAPSGLAYAVNGYINDQNLIERVETWVEHDMLGDMHVDATYSDYKDLGGLQVPGKMTQKRGGHTFFEVTVAAAQANPATLTELLTPPPPPAGRAGGGGPPGGAPGAGRGGAPGAGRGGAPAAPAAAPEASTKLADGVYRINGAYNALAVEFDDYIVVVEAGQNIARGQAIVDEVKRLFPAKPIRYVVNSHPHSDHSSGLAPLVAEGATIVTYRNNEKFFEDTFSAPRTLVGDNLAKNRRKPKVEGIGAKKVFKDDNHSLELHHFIDRETEKVHSDGIIVAYLPKEKILFQADFTLPAAGAKPNPFVQSLGENLARLKLDFDAYMSVHDTPLQQTRKDLMTATGTSW